MLRSKIQSIKKEMRRTAQSSPKWEELDSKLDDLQERLDESMASVTQDVVEQPRGPFKSSKARDVEVRKSTIKGAGCGLFAAVSLAKNTLLPQPYRGKKLSYEQFKHVADCSYCFHVNDARCPVIDGRLRTKNNPLRYVNGARTQGQKRMVNVAAIKRNGQIWYVTIQPVPCGCEFFIDYGPEYWKWFNRRRTSLVAK